LTHKYLCGSASNDTLLVFVDKIAYSLIFQGEENNSSTMSPSTPSPAVPPTSQILPRHLTVSQYFEEAPGASHTPSFLRKHSRLRCSSPGCNNKTSLCCSLCPTYQHQKIREGNLPVMLCGSGTHSTCWTQHLRDRHFS
jgi:hypothetical protein